MAKIEWKTQEEIEQEQAEQDGINSLPTDKERIEMLEKENTELKQANEEMKQRAELVEEVVLMILDTQLQNLGLVD